jgi:hypothetical protein
LSKGGLPKANIVCPILGSGNEEAGRKKISKEKANEKK